MKHFFTIGLLFLIAKLGFAQDAFINAHMAYEAIKEEERMLHLTDASQPTDLPIGMYKEIAGQEYIISVDSFVLSPGASYISASSVLEIPEANQKIAFSGSRIPVSPSGIKNLSVGRLELASDIPIKLTNDIKLTLKGRQKKTYVEFDCNGFQGMGVEGEFEFCRKFLIPVQPDGSIAPESERVKAQFETKMSNWGNILAKVSITPFQVPELKGFDFYVQDAWVDQSDAANPLSLVFPRDYKSTEFADTNQTMWKGFFLKQLSVKLPKQFETQNSNQRKEFVVSNAIIDRMGFSGWISQKGLLPINEGSMTGWPFSVDEIAIGITCNKLTGAGFKGTLTIPISKEDHKLNYTAIIESGNNYLFSVSSRETLEVPLWGATMHLLPTSVLTVTYQNDKFLPKVLLNGDISLSPDMGNGGDKGEFKGIRFENLVVQAVKPYIVPGVFSIESTNNKAAGFTFTIKEIGMVRRESENLIGLHLGVAIHLMNDSDGGFSGETAFTVFGKEDKNYKFDHLEINKIKIDVYGSAYKISGELNLYKKDKIYGSGFRGKVEAEFQPGIKISATAQFGNVSGLRYWYVDALLKLPTGTPVGPGFALYGFGGGLYHHMKRSDMNNVKLDKAPLAQNSEVSGSTVAQVENIQPPPSGITYVPDEKIFLGLKATVIAGTFPTATAFNADATFEIAFNDKAGVNYVAFDGIGYFMTDINDRGQKPPVKAVVSISMDFVNEVLHGNFDVYVNVGDYLKGIHPEGLAGGAVMHFDKQDWYIHIGTPDSRLGLNFMNLFQATSYFMVGTSMPGMPAPPQNVSDILGGVDLNFMRDENALSKGGGFCFGASLDANTGKKQFLIFYGQFSAGAGFDIMLKNYGSNVRCEGRTEPMGMNGWYASGQAYSYLQGEIGIRVDLVFVTGEYKILEIGAAAVLQAKLPNPTFLKGQVGGYYAILGGKVKGNCRFEVTVGEQCKIVGGSVLSGLNVIGEVSPKEGESKVNVYNNPQATFNSIIDKEIELEDLDGQVKVFKPILSHFKLMDGSTEIPGTLEWNESMDVVAFNSTDILPGKKTIKASVKVSFEEKKNGVWNPVVFNGKAIEEIKELSFTTGEAPDYIPLSNVQYSYPLINQLNLLQKESKEGYIKLAKGQDDLFEFDANWNRKARLIKVDDNSVSEIDFAYNNSENIVTFSIPSNLQNDKIYAFELVNIPANEHVTVDANVKTESKDLTGDGSATLESKKLEGSYDNLEEKVFYESNFKTSKFNSFIEKMNALDKSEGWSFPLNINGVDEIGTNIQGAEVFDKFEISGDKNIAPLISMKAALNNNWYSNKIYPLLYEKYPLNGSISILWRTPSELGVPPVKSVAFRQTQDNRVLSEGEVSSGSALPLPPYSQLVYSMPYYCYRDYFELSQKAAAALTGNYQSNGDLAYIVTHSYPNISSGKYEVELSYTLPGKNIVTNVYKIIIRNP